ncbi:MAG: hypothetical protein IPM37_12650 [Hahellaceae bacterium]|nr:hypothetical protein [Hahellaceae bacterium]
MIEALPEWPCQGEVIADSWIVAVLWPPGSLEYFKMVFPKAVSGKAASIEAAKHWRYFAVKAG